MLADDLAESIANCTTPICVGGLGRQLLRLRRSLAKFSEGAYLLDGAEANPVSLAQGAIDRTCFGHAHFGTVDEERDIGRIGITITDKAGGGLGREDRRLPDKPARSGTGKRLNNFNMDSTAVPAARQSNQAGVCDVPAAVDNLKISVAQRKTKFSR